MIYSAMALSLLMFVTGTGGQTSVARPAVMSPDGDFSVAMPGTPHVGMIPTPLTPKLVTRSWSVNDGLRNEYLVSWTDYREHVASLPATVAGSARACEALVQARSGRLLDSSEITVDGRPARACSFTESDGRLTKARFVATQARFYQVMASVTGAGANDEADRFLNSFKWR